MPLATNHTTSRSKGFTLIELITVIIVLGIIAAVAVPRLPNVGLFQSQFDGRQVVSSLSRLRSHAMASQCYAVADFTNNTLSAELTGNSDCTGSLDFISATDIEGLSWDGSEVFKVVFTPLGEALFYSGSTVDLDNPDATTSQDLTHGPTGRTIVIEGSTGYARWQ